ncbi:MAG: LysR family transcriptional regulator [Gluconacetobacter diazotrophicus]|nr:LysR family transcriptional regulator [Gluconacetobacter diazotrophicus]
MTTRINLDTDALRTFLAGFDLGSFARAAARVGRSQSAVSSQLRRLEEQVGRTLVRKAGRGLALTEAGETLLGYARRLLELNDEAVERLREAELAGPVRLGLPQDFADTALPAVLRRFARAHPGVRIELEVDRSAVLAERTLGAALDLALAWGDANGAPHAVRVAEIPTSWIAPPDWCVPDIPVRDNPVRDALPLVAFSPPCRFRAAAAAALDAAGLSWRPCFTSPSLSGLWAAVRGGLGLTARTAIGMPDTLAALDPAAAGLPPLPPMPLTLYRAEAEPAPAVRRLAEILLDAIRTEAAAPLARPRSPGNGASRDMP